jgi:hypothetical protein
MFDDLEALFLENVLAAYNEFSASLDSDTLGESRDLRLGMTAATDLYHFREHVPVPAQKSRQALAAICPDYDLLGDVVNAGKHRDVARGTPRVKSAADIQEVVVMTEYEDADGPYQHQRKAVEVALVDGSTRELKDRLKSVLDMWIAELKAMGLVANLKTAASEAPAGIPPRQTPSGAGTMNFVALKGTRFRVTYRRQKYNDATGQIEPVDITGHNYEMNIYEPPGLELEVVMTHSQTGQRLQRTVELSADEAAAYRAFKTDAERARFVNEIAAKHRDVLRDLVREAQEVGA